MTTDLDRLIEAVQGAAWTPNTNDRYAIAEGSGGRDNILWAQSAYHGSLDAAVSLLKALLPGWGWSIHDDGWAAAYTPCGKRKTFLAEIANKPSRALLLATLRAYRSTREGE